MVDRTRGAASGSASCLYLSFVFHKGALHEQHRLPRWRSRRHHRCIVIPWHTLIGDGRAQRRTN